MKAFLANAPQSYGLADVPVPSIKRDELLVRIGACGICGSDIDLLEGSRPMEVTAYPVILGHEFSGEVADLGSEVTGFSTGDKIVIDTLVRCDQCRNCRLGWTCHCLTEFQQLGCTKPGGMAEFVTVPQRLAYHLPKEIDLAEAALAEPASCSAHAVSKAGIKPGDSVVIVGAGTIGALAIQVARLFSPANLIAVEIDNQKLELCGKLGATHAVNGKTENVTQAVLEITKGLGADAIIECTGSLEPIQQAFSYVGTKGRIVVVGMPPQKRFEIDFLALQLRDAVFRPSNGYTTSIWLWTLRLLCKHVFDARTIITHRFPLSKVDEAFATLRERRDGAIKVMTSARWD